jgi:hypothetical protein
LVYYEGYQFHLFRAIIFLGYILWFYTFKRNKVKTKSFQIYKYTIFILTIYWLLASYLNSDDVVQSLRTSLTNILPLILSTCVSYDLIRKKDFEYHIFKSLSLSLFVFVSFFILSNIFSLTSNVYDESSKFTSGLSDAHLYYPPLALFGIYILGNKKLFHYALIGITVIILILSLRRTAILLFPMAYFLFVLMNRKQILRNIVFLLLMTTVIVASYPLYNTYLEKQIESRGNVFSGEYEATEELRVLETILILDDFKNKNNFIENLFGQNLFNSAGNYGEGRFGKRVIHVDYNLILHGSGFIGLFLYLNVFIALFFLISKNSFSYNKKIAIIYFILMVIISFSGQMHIITFRIYLFAIIVLLSLRHESINN